MLVENAAENAEKKEVDETIAKSEKHVETDIYPDGGFRAWLVVLGVSTLLISCFKPHVLIHRVDFSHYLWNVSTDCARFCLEGSFHLFNQLWLREFVGCKIFFHFFLKH